MDEDHIAKLFERLGLTAEKRADFIGFAQQGPLSLSPEQPAASGTAEDRSRGDR
jgi:hypothetical protein